jgi:hypothetical protein
MRSPQSPRTAQQMLSLVASLLVTGFTISGWLAAANYA